MPENWLDCPLQGMALCKARVLPPPNHSINMPVKESGQSVHNLFHQPNKFDDHESTRKDVESDKPIGYGAFGVVWYVTRCLSFSPILILVKPSPLACLHRCRFVVFSPLEKNLQIFKSRNLTVYNHLIMYELFSIYSGLSQTQERQNALPWRKCQTYFWISFQANGFTENFVCCAFSNTKM